MKAYLLFLYGVSLFITLKAWYKDGNSGVPDPTVIGPATYLFALFLLTANFIGGLSGIFGTATTFTLYLRSTTKTQQQQSSGVANKNSTGKPPPGPKGPLGIGAK